MFSRPAAHTKAECPPFIFQETEDMEWETLVFVKSVGYNKLISKLLTMNF